MTIAVGILSKHTRYFLGIFTKKYKNVVNLVLTQCPFKTSQNQ